MEVKYKYTQFTRDRNISHLLLFKFSEYNYAVHRVGFELSKSIIDSYGNYIVAAWHVKWKK